ncbi:MAG: glycosyltransferase [Candidatus Thorarchaeota archaeon]
MTTSSSLKRKIQIVMTLYGSLPVDTRVLREASVLHKSGYDVTVLDVGFGLKQDYVPEGVHRCSVIRIPFSQRISMKGLLRFWLKCFKGLLDRRRSIDIVHAHDLTGLPPAFAFVAMHPNTKLVYDSHELFPEAARSKLSTLQYLVFLGLELVCGILVNRLITVSPSILQILSKRISAPAVRLMNVPDLERIKLNLGYIPKWNGPRNDNTIRIAYPGRVLVQRGYEKIIDSAEILRTSGKRKFEFWIIGDGPLLPDLKDIIRKRNLEDLFKFTGRVAFEELLGYVSECDMAIGLYEDTPNNNLGLSNKLFEYMMIGVPFIFTNLTQSLPLLETVGAWVLENPVSGEALASAILSLHDDSARVKKLLDKGPNLIAMRFNWSTEAKSLVRLYKDIRRGLIRS